MGKRIFSWMLVLTVLLGLLPGAASAADIDPDTWFDEDGRELVVCGVTVTPENARDILEGSSYSGSTAELSFMSRGSTFVPILTLTDLTLNDPIQHVVKYTGTGAPDDILYIEIVNRNTEESVFSTAENNIFVTDASLDLSGGKLTLEESVYSALEVENGDLHIHDIVLNAAGWDSGIRVKNGKLTVSGRDTVVTLTSGHKQQYGEPDTSPVYGLDSAPSAPWGCVHFERRSGHHRPRGGKGRGGGERQSIQRLHQGEGRRGHHRGAGHQKGSRPYRGRRDRHL